MKSLLNCAFQAALNRHLTQEHRAIGLDIFVSSEGAIFLRRDGIMVKEFSQDLFISSIIHEADQHLEWSRSGVSFERKSK